MDSNQVTARDLLTMRWVEMMGPEGKKFPAGGFEKFVFVSPNDPNKRVVAWVQDQDGKNWAVVYDRKDRVEQVFEIYPRG
jgi:hypothetical protein